MASPRTSIRKGFSLIEVLVVIGMFAIVAAIGVFVGLDSFRHSAFRNDRDTIIAALQKARSQAVSNVCLGTCAGGAPHGLHIDQSVKTYTIFQGASYSAADPLNEVIPATADVILSGATDIVFSQLSGNATPGTITVGGGQTSAIEVEASGRIWWTN